MPRLSIGMPLYNNERTIHRALTSIAEQTFTDFQVTLSDDGSTDGTVAIVQAFAAKDRRFTLVRQPVNLNYGNFRYLVQQAEGELFLFAAGDDWWEPTFIERCIAALDANAQAVCAVSQVMFVDDDQPTELARGTYALTGELRDRVSAYLRDPSDNSRTYGVFRTKVARASFPLSNHHAFDWTYCAATLAHGTHIEVPAVLMFRETTPSAKYGRYVRRDAATVWDRVLPLRGLTSALLFEKHVPMSLPVVRALAAANLWAHLNYVRVAHPRYYRLTSPVLRRIHWRL